MIDTFLVIFLLIAIVFGAQELFRARASFDFFFKMFATCAVMLPIMVAGTLFIFVTEVILCMVVLLALDFTGLVHFADIPHQYQVFGLSTFLIIAIGCVGFYLVRYRADIVRKERNSRRGRTSRYEN